MNAWIAYFLGLAQGVGLVIIWKADALFPSRRGGWKPPKPAPPEPRAFSNCPPDRFPQEPPMRNPSGAARGRSKP